MKKKFFVLSFMLLILCLPTVGMAEKQVSIKGLYIGMPVDEAKSVVERILVGGWKTTGMDYFRDDIVFGKRRIDCIVGGVYGFGIQRNNLYEGYIGVDKNTKKVSQIVLKSEILEALYVNGKEKFDIEEFVPLFTKRFELPDFRWIAYGWNYESPMGYIITFKTDGSLDIKMDEKLMPKYGGAQSKYNLD